MQHVGRDSFGASSRTEQTPLRRSASVIRRYLSGHLAFRGTIRRDAQASAATCRHVHTYAPPDHGRGLEHSVPQAQRDAPCCVTPNGCGNGDLLAPVLPRQAPRTAGPLPRSTGQTDPIPVTTFDRQALSRAPRERVAFHSAKPRPLFYLDHPNRVKYHLHEIERSNGCEGGTV